MSDETIENTDIRVVCVDRTVSQPLDNDSHVLGVKYLNDCPIQPNLPVYLLVAGSMGLVRALNLLWKQFRRRRMRKLDGLELDQEEDTVNSLSRLNCLTPVPHSPVLSRWLGVHRCRAQSLSARVVHRRAVLDVECLHAQLRVRHRESRQLLS